MARVAESEQDAIETHPDGAYDADGVDVTLIREMLARTPQERLEALQGFMKGLIELQRAAGST